MSRNDRREKMGGGVILNIQESIQASNYHRAIVCMYINVFLLERLAPRVPNFQGLFYDPTNET